MKRLCSLLGILMLGLFALDACGDTVKVKPKDQLEPMSLSVDRSVAGLGATYLSDGVDGFVGISAHAYSIAPRTSLNILAVTDANNTRNSYVGSLLTQKVFDTQGFSLSVGVGYKGINLLNGNFSDTRGFLFGIQATVPLRD